MGQSESAEDVSKDGLGRETSFSRSDLRPLSPSAEGDSHTASMSPPQISSGPLYGYGGDALPSGPHDHSPGRATNFAGFPPPQLHDRNGRVSDGQRETGPHGALHTPRSAAYMNQVAGSFSPGATPSPHSLTDRVKAMMNMPDEQKDLQSGMFPQAAGQPAVVPCMFSWTHGGKAVDVTGSFNGWTSTVPLRLQESAPGSVPVFSAVVNVPAGTHQFRFLVDQQV